MKYIFLSLSLCLLMACARVSGVVVDQSGAPIGGASVSVDCSKSVKKTSPSGRFHYRPKCPMFTETTTLRVTVAGQTRVVPNVKFKKPVEIVIGKNQ